MNAGKISLLRFFFFQNMNSRWWRKKKRRNKNNGIHSQSVILDLNECIDQKVWNTCWTNRRNCKSIQTYFYSPLPVSGLRVAGADSIWHWARGRVASFPQGWLMETKNHTHILTDNIGNSESINHLTYYAWMYPRRTHTSVCVCDLDLWKWGIVVM